MEDSERECGESQSRYDQRTMNIGNYTVEFTLFDGKFDQIDEIRTTDNLIDCDLYAKSDSDKFVKLESYLNEKIMEVYGD